MKNAIVVFFGLLLLSGCGSYRQAVQMDDKAYLLLIGNTDGLSISIDDGQMVDLAKNTVSFSLNGKQATKIEVKTGAHSVKIMKDGNVVVHRKFYVSNGSSFEVNL